MAKRKPKKHRRVQEHYSPAAIIADMPAAEIAEADLRDGVIDIMGLLVSAGLCASRSEARRAVEQGGVTVNGEKVTDIKTTYTPDDIKNAEEFVLKRGKKKFCKIVMK